MIDAHGYDNTVRLVFEKIQNEVGLLSYRREVCVARLQGWAVVGLKRRDGQRIWLSRFSFFIPCHLGALALSNNNMNPLQGIKFYDSINRLVIGFLASLWIFFCPNIFRRELDPAIVTATYLIACYILGLFFSLLVDRISTVKFSRCLGNIFYKNDIIRIRRAAARKKVILTNSKEQPAIDAYFEKYYAVQRASLLGNVPAMETISAFLMNLAALCILYMTGALLVILFTCNCCQYIWIPILSLFLVIFAKIARNYVEDNIYKAILSASKFLEQKSKNSISSNR